MKTVQGRGRWLRFALMGGLIALSTNACYRGPVKLTEARDIPQSLQLQFVRLGHEMRDLACLQSVDWDHPDPHCLDVAREANMTLHDLLSTEMTELSASKYPRLREFMLMAFELRHRVEKVGMSITFKDRSRGVEEAAADVGRRAFSAEKVIDAAFTIDDPSWGEAWKTPPVHATSPSPPPVAAKPAEPEKKAENPTSTPESPAASPSPSVAPSAAAGATALLPENAAPVGPGASSLLEPLTQSLKLLSGAEHQPGQLVNASTQAQTLLTSLGASLRIFRESPRSEARQAEAALYADKVDQARGIMLRACTKYSSAARRVIQVTGDDFVFREADELLEKAQADVDALQHSIPAGLD